MGDQSIDQGANCGHFGANDVELLEGPSLFLRQREGAPKIFGKLLQCILDICEALAASSTVVFIF